MGKLETLIVDMQLQFAELHKGLEKVKDELKETSEHVEGLLEFEVLKEVGEFAVEAAEKLGEFVLSGAEAADSMGKLAQQAGVPIEEFSRLSYAAKLSKVGTEEFGAALSKLNVAIAGAASGAKQQSALFQALGVAVKDAAGNTRDSGAVLKDLADRFSQMQDGASKGKLAVELFGKAGRQLIPFLNEGKEGLARLGEEADRLGLVLSEKTVRAATEFADNIEGIKAAVQGVATRVAAQLSPALAELTGELLHSAAGAETLKQATDAIVVVCRVVITAVISVVEAFHLWNEAVAFTEAGLLALATGHFADAAEIMKTGVATIGDELEKFKGRVEKVWDDNAKAFDEATKRHGLNADKIVADAKRMEDAEKRAAEAAQSASEAAKLIHEMFDRDTRDKTLAMQLGANLHSEAERRAGFEAIGRTPQQQDQLDTRGFADFNDALKRYTAAQNAILEDTRKLEELKKAGQVQEYEDTLDAIENQKRIAEKANKAGNAFEDIAKQAKAAMEKTISAIVSLTASLFTKMGALGEVLQTGIQGFQAGGVWGAIIAVVIDLFSRFEGFGKLIDQGNQIIKNLIDTLRPGFEALAGGLFSFMSGIDKLLQAVGSLLNGPLRGVGIMFDQLGRTLNQLFDGIGPAIEALGGIIDVVMTMIQMFDPMKPIITVLGAIFKLVGIALLELVRGLQMFVGWVVDGIRNLLLMIPVQTPELEKMELKLSELANKMNAGAEASAAKAEKMWADLGHQFDDPFGMDEGGAASTDGPVARHGGVLARTFDLLGKASEKTAAAMNKLSEQFTNVPAGFRVALRTFQATTPVGGGDQITLHVHGSLVTENDLAERLKKMQGGAKFRKLGLGGG